MALEPTYLGIDLGSTSCRICLYTSTTHAMIEVDCPEHSEDCDSHILGDFSTRCYPFNEASKIYDGNAHDRGNIAASLKPVLLFLSELPEEDLRSLIIEHPVAQEILDHLHIPGFTNKLERGIQQLFAVLWEATQKLCVERQLCITGIGVTTPKQWLVEVDNLYAKMILDWFGKPSSKYRRITPESIFFLGETQAFAHFLFHQHSYQIWEHGFEKGVLLILDFGGQNLGVSMYHVHCTADKKRAFFEIGRSQGFVGGSEQFDYFIGEYCEEYIRKHHGESLLPGTEQGLIDQFHRKKRRLDQDFVYKDEGDEMLLSWGSHFTVPLPPKVVEDAFNKALGGPLAQMDDLLSKVSQDTAGCESRGPLVIVTGGSARIKALQARLIQTCVTNGHRKPLFVIPGEITIASRFRSHVIAKGAVFAMASTLTVEEFPARSAIGLQMRQSNGTLWDSEAQILFFQGATSTPIIQIRDHDELKLICDPAHVDAPGEHTVHSATAYDLYTLGYFRRGTLKTSLALGGTAEDVYLDISLSWNPRFPDPPSKKWEEGLIKLPLFADRSTCCVLVESSNVESRLPPSSVMGPPPRIRVKPDPDNVDADISSHFHLVSASRVAAQKVPFKRAGRVEEDRDDVTSPELAKTRAEDDGVHTSRNGRRRRLLNNTKRMGKDVAPRRQRSETYMYEEDDF